MGNIARMALESMYTGKATITAYVKTVDEYHATQYSEKVLYTDVPCRLSHKNVMQASADESGAYSAGLVTELITNPDITIPENSKITVTQAGVTRDYGMSGVPAVYESHQEVILAKWDGWA